MLLLIVHVFEVVEEARLQQLLGQLVPHVRHDALKLGIAPVVEDFEQAGAVARRGRHTKCGERRCR